MGLAACSTIASGDDEAGVTTNQSSGEGSSSDSDEGESNSSDTHSTAGSSGPSSNSGTDDTGAETDPGDDGFKLDIPSSPDLPPLPPEDCTTTWLSWDQVAAVYPDCAIDPDDDGGGCWTEPMIGCTAPGPKGCVCPEGDCLETWANCMGDSQGWSDATPSEVCGPYVIDGLCCSIGEFIYGCAE
ncbi:hypothetical protein ACNOYE_04835 [Nannocystaceae bacterium ST9]